MKNSLDRRSFLATSAAASAALAVTTTTSAEEDKPALLGGKPIRREPFPGWPRFDQRDEKNLLDVLHSGKWFRGGGDCVNRFEAAYRRAHRRPAIAWRPPMAPAPSSPRWRRWESSRATR